MHCKITCSILLLLFFKIKCYTTQAVNDTNGANSPSSVDSRFFDLNNRGYPNERNPGRFENSPSNYPGNNFGPYGNQNGYMQRPQGYGWNPNPGYYQTSPYHPPGNYPGNQGPNNFNGFNPNLNNMNQNPNYQRPYFNGPGDGNVYPGDINNGPYQNGGVPIGQGQYPSNPNGVPDDMMPIRYPPQTEQYPPQGDFQGNPNLGPGGFDSNIRPTYPGNFNSIPDSGITFPGNRAPYPYNSNYNPNQNNLLPYPSNNRPNNVQYLPNSPSNNDGSVQFPNEILNNPGNNMGGFNQSPPGNNNRIPPEGPQSWNTQQINSNNGPNTNDTSADQGKPGFTPPSTLSPGLVFDGSTESPSQRQCIENCQTTSEYVPICGTNNVTYINPGKFYCTRNCGIAVNIRQMGKCSADAS